MNTIFIVTKTIVHFSCPYRVTQQLILLAFYNLINIIPIHHNCALIQHFILEMFKINTQYFVNIYIL